MPVLSRLDDLLLNRVFQPAAEAMAEAATPAEAARFCLTGAMVFLLARLLADAAVALPGWPVLFDLLGLWGGMALMQAFSLASAARLNPLRGQLGLARRLLVVVALVQLATGESSLAESFCIMQIALWCAALYFASCDPASRLRGVIRRSQPAVPPAAAAASGGASSGDRRPTPGPPSAA